MKKAVKEIFVLVAICTVLSVLLAAVNGITSPIIEANQQAAADAALLEVMPEGKSFEKMDVSAYELPATVVEVYRAESGGYVFKLNATGFKPNMIIMCGVDASYTVTGAVCLSSEETWGKEATFGELLVGKNGDTVVDVEASATSLTVKGYRSAVKDAINAAVILGGGSVDIRTEEQILADNLSAALPAGEGAFTKLFIVEVIEGIDAVYEADNGKGSVCVVDDVFIAVDEQGKAQTEDAELAAHIEAQMSILRASSQTPVDKTAFEGISKNVESVSKTASGNYVLTVKGAGYGIQGEWQASGEYIVIRVSMTPDGRIIDCLTVSQKETDGFGSACADEDFYGQFDGKTQADYDQIVGISGATLTTNGYKLAILRAFEAVAIIEGGVANE